MAAIPLVASPSNSLAVEHVTTYHYRSPVRFGQHRLMFRPREGHDVQVIEAAIEVNVPSRIDWVQDTQSNSVTLVTPLAQAAELKLECRFRIQQHRVNSAQDLPLAPHAQRWPFDYSPEERRDLSAMLEPHYPDPESVVRMDAPVFHAGCTTRHEENPDVTGGRDKERAEV